MGEKETISSESRGSTSVAVRDPVVLIVCHVLATSVYLGKWMEEPSRRRNGGEIEISQPMANREPGRVDIFRNGVLALS